MGQRARSSRWALWAAVAALLLKAAVPVLAATAAYLQGVPVAAVCHVYGVSMPPSAHAEHHREGAEPSGEPQHHEPAPHSSSAHTGDHCALTSLAAMAVPAVVTVSAALAPAATPLRDPYGTAASQRDACASWAAQLQHPPPISA